MKKLALITLLFLSFNIYSQDNTLKHKHYLGVHAGAISGLGFSYRYWPKKFGFQTTFIPIFKKGGDSFISSGLSLLYNIKEGKHVDLYAYAGFHLINITTVQTVYDPNSPTGTSKFITTINSYNTGLGIGLKFKIYDVLDLCFQGGYGIYNMRKNEITNKPSFVINFAGGVGLYYKL